MSILGILESQPSAGPWKKVAVFDGKGESATVGLYWENEDTGEIVDIEWPDEFPGWVTMLFLRNKGFECFMA